MQYSLFEATTATARFHWSCVYNYGSLKDFQDNIFLYEPQRSFRRSLQHLLCASSSAFTTVYLWFSFSFSSNNLGRFIMNNEWHVTGWFSFLSSFLWQRANVRQLLCFLDSIQLAVKKHGRLARWWIALCAFKNSSQLVGRRPLSSSLIDLAQLCSRKKGIKEQCRCCNLFIDWSYCCAFGST